ncbi:MAG: phage portal protein [Lentisphaeria bacterium]|nr:phage portal protein [Lentisphaeria bacterium]
MNIVNKVISKISPEWALKRTVAEYRLDRLNAMNYGGGGYGRHGASASKNAFAGWFSDGGDADADIVDNIETLRDRSRDLFMGAPLATGALKTIRTNVVGSGLMLAAKPDAKFLGLSDEQAREWQKKTEREWRLWSESVNCDAERKLNFYQLQSLVMLSALMSGDIFAVTPYIRRAGSVYDLCIGLIEADRVCNPVNPTPPVDANILGGVEIGQYGETVAYWICNQNPNAYPRTTVSVQKEWKRIPAFGEKTGRRNVLHIMADVERPAQRRGVPLFAPVIEALKQLKRYSDAELMAAVISGMFTVYIKSNNPTQGLSGMPMPGGFNPMNAEKPMKDPNNYAMGNGTAVLLEDGEEVQTANPGRPNTAFEGFVVAICRQIGAAVELPYELLLKHFTASYSASRGALLEAWKMFRMRREWLIGGFCQPVYEEWLTEAILKGRIDAPGYFDDPAYKAAWCGADWFGDCQGQLDPLKEANAAKVRVDEGFSTRDRESSELTGMKYEEIHVVRKREEDMRKADGLTPGAAQPAPAPVENGDGEDGNEE